MLPHPHAPKWCSWSRDGGATRLVGITWGPCRNHPGPPMDDLLTFLPSSPGVPSSPWEQRLPVSAHSTISTWVQTEGWLRTWGFFAKSSPCLMLYWDRYPSASWESPKVNPCFPYSHSCHSGQVCHPHRVCPGRKKKGSEPPGYPPARGTSSQCLDLTGASRCMEGELGTR